MPVASAVGALGVERLASVPDFAFMTRARPFVLWRFGVRLRWAGRLHVVVGLSRLANGRPYFCELFGSLFDAEPKADGEPARTRRPSLNGTASWFDTEASHDALSIERNEPANRIAPVETGCHVRKTCDPCVHLTVARLSQLGRDESRWARGTMLAHKRESMTTSTYRHARVTREPAATMTNTRRKIPTSQFVDDARA